MKAFVAILAAAMLAVVFLAVTTSQPETNEHADDSDAQETTSTETQPASTAPSQLTDVAPPKAKPAPSGPLAPDFELAMGNGELVRLSDYRGSVVVLDFWATWCGPCMVVLPQVNKLSEWAQANEPRIKVFAVHTMERNPRAALVALVANKWERMKLSMLVLFDYGAVVARQYNVRSIPQTFIIGPEGHVAAHHIGYKPGEDMAEKLKQECYAALGEE